jgi:hypothetical protein
MRQNSSTMTSVPTDIDNDRSYVFMSSGLEAEVQLEVGSEVEHPKVLVKLDGKWSGVTFVSLENETENSIVLCINSGGFVRKLTRLLLNGGQTEVSIDGSKFKSHVMKLESNRSYLRITRSL